MDWRHGHVQIHRALILGAVATLILVLPASAGGARVTRGDFHAFAAGTGMDISGHAVMIRTAQGRTFVSVHVEGLAANTTYASHVHKQACGVGDADGHYQHDGTAVDDENEIWPGFTTNGAGVGNGNARNHFTARDSAISVVIHRPGSTPNKIACADLQ